MDFPESLWQNWTENWCELCCLYRNKQSIRFLTIATQDFWQRRHRRYLLFCNKLFFRFLFLWRIFSGLIFRVVGRTIVNNQ